MKKGERVGAILGSNKDGSINFFGYGVYDGKEIPLKAVGQMAEIMREGGIGNPKLKLDSGDVVYGCESWWGPEEKIKQVLENKVVNPVSITEVRKKFNEK